MLNTLHTKMLLTKMHTRKIIYIQKNNQFPKMTIFLCSLNKKNDFLKLKILITFQKN